MQLSLILLFLLLAGCSARNVTHGVETGTLDSQRIPNLWVMKITEPPDITNKHKLESKVIFDEGKNYIQLIDGRRIPIMLVPIGHGNASNENVNMDFDIRLLAPLVFGHETTKEIVVKRDEKDHSILGFTLERTFNFYPSHLFVYTSKVDGVEDLPLWEINYNKKVVGGTFNGNVSWLQFSIRKVVE